ncbi:MAG: four-helix bundle copper-binding protein [Neisseria sp.]|nr:four-helix bundle copper-binding protein [Neisseria sp.]
MNRRQFIGSAAAVSLSTVAATAAAHGMHNHGSHDHAHHAHTAANNPYDALRTATGHCQAAGNVCLAHCIRLLSQGDTSMKDCATNVNQMLALCGALSNLAAQQSSLVPQLAKVALQACRACAAACKEHAGHHAECKACYESCLACIKECEKVAA